MNLRYPIAVIGLLVVLNTYGLGVNVERGEYVHAGALAAFIVIGLIYIWALIRLEGRL